jgi:hypothetical protein
LNQAKVAYLNEFFFFYTRGGFSFNCPLIDSVEFLHVEGKENENGGGWGRWLTLLGTGIILWDGCSFIFQLAAIFENIYFRFRALQLFACSTE